MSNSIPTTTGRTDGSPPPGWTQLPVEHLPRATSWPAGLALAITFLFWGLITSWVILTLGGALFVVSLAGWITNLRDERKHP
jgi:hypothetical protein